MTLSPKSSYLDPFWNLVFCSNRKMPRKTKNRGNSRSSKGINDRSVLVPFKALLDTTGAATYTQALNPAAISTRVSAVGDGFELYKLVKLRFRLLPSTNPMTGVFAACFLPGVVDNPPASAATVTSCMNHAILGLTQSVPSGWVNVDKVSLQGYQPWYKTIVGTPNPAEEIQGNIFVIAATPTRVLMEFDGVIAFKGAVDVAATPQMRREAMFADEYARMSRILAEGPRILAKRVSFAPAGAPTGHP